MSLFIANLIMGGFLLGIATLLFPQVSTLKVNRFLRSTEGNALYFIPPVLWFCYQVTQLTEADFGEHKHLILAGSVFVAIFAFRYVPDFLSVRGLCMGALMLASPFLKAAYMEPPLSRLYLVSFVYLLIVSALYFSVYPYKVRDTLHWMDKRPSRIKVTASSIGAFGAVLIGCAFLGG